MTMGLFKMLHTHLKTHWAFNEFKLRQQLFNLCSVKTKQPSTLNNDNVTNLNAIFWWYLKGTARKAEPDRQDSGEKIPRSSSAFHFPVMHCAQEARTRSINHLGNCQYPSYSFSAGLPLVFTEQRGDWIIKDGQRKAPELTGMRAAHTDFRCNL